MAFNVTVRLNADGDDYKERDRRKQNAHTYTQQKTKEEEKMNSSQLRDGESDVARAHEKNHMSRDCRKIYRYRNSLIQIAAMMSLGI